MKPPASCVDRANHRRLRPALPEILPACSRSRFSAARGPADREAVMFVRERIFAVSSDDLADRQRIDEPHPPAILRAPAGTPRALTEKATTHDTSTTKNAYRPRISRQLARHKPRRQRRQLRRLHRRYRLVRDRDQETPRTTAPEYLDEVRPLRHCRPADQFKDGSYVTPDDEQEVPEVPNLSCSPTTPWSGGSNLTAPARRPSDTWGCSLTAFVMPSA